jgi:DNA-binding response OmpR family regulator
MRCFAQTIHQRCNTTAREARLAARKVVNVIAAKKAGVNNYIVKPFNVQTLKAKIEGVFAEKAMHISAAER